MPTVPPDEANLQEATKLLRAGQIVVFPTETVYGLGANALDAAAVERVFAAKGRPNDNPVIVHVATIDHAQRLAATWSPLADRLARAFWPGPLTIIVPRGKDIPDAVTGGLDSVALRVPSHPVAMALLRACKMPLAAPSANTSGRPSPTEVGHALADLGDKVPLYIDGGPCEIGVESTVVSCLGEHPVLLRQGGVPIEALRRVVKEWGTLGAGASGASGHTPTAPGEAGMGGASGAPLAPGMKYRHYAPKAKVRILDEAGLRAEWRKQGGDPKVAFIVGAETAAGGMSGRNVAVPGKRGDSEMWAKELFALLRKWDNKREILVEAIPEKGLGAAVMERLRKAAQG